jgi:periplasmic divalent cation tolerance protein
MIDVWINCPDDETARRIGSALVERRLAACANVFPRIWSAYHWQGSIATEDETPLLVKTRDDLFDALCETVRELHPYDVPSVVGTPVTHVNAEYASWVDQETRH